MRFVSTEAIFLQGISHLWKAWQLASEIVVALSEQNISQTLHFENSIYRIEQLTMLFAPQNVLYWFRVSDFYITMLKSSINCNSIVLLRSNFAGMVGIFITPPSLTGCAPQMQLCSWLSASICKCMYVWINSSHCCMADICWSFDKLSIFSTPCL